MLKTITFEELKTISFNEFDTAKEDAVKEIINNVRLKKDSALLRYTTLFDNVTLSSLKATKDEIDEAFNNLDPVLKSDLNQAFQNILTYHKKQSRNGYLINISSSSYVGQRITPIDAVGLYVPAGTAPLPSSVLMNAAPAKIAGVKRIVLVTPPNKAGRINPVILAACKIAGIDEVYKVGGAQAIAALAYGTETIQPVNKIVGPGNIYVALAKKQVFGKVGIDMIAGPSEIVVYADNTSNPRFVAADLLSQAEHDTLAKAILVTESTDLIESVNKELERQSKKLERFNIIKESLENESFVVKVSSKEEAYDVINHIAPEHLEIIVEDTEDALENIRNAGAIFIGSYSSEPLGDYFAGPNHTLPTSGTATYSSPLNVDDFIKKTSIINYSKEDLLKIKDSIVRIAQVEGLTAHANAIKERFK